jgi:hypothetical protein
MIAFAGIILLLFGSACTTYSPSLTSTALMIDPKERAEALSFSFLPGHKKSYSESRRLTEDDRRRKGFAKEGQVLMTLFSQHSGFNKVVTTAVPPALGTHINVYQTNGRFPPRWCLIAELTLFILPCYEDDLLFENHFDVYVDNKLKGTYRYEIRREAVYWIGLFPFLFGDKTRYTDAFSATVHQFITDARRDGVI